MGESDRVAPRHSNIPPSLVQCAAPGVRPLGNLLKTMPLGRAGVCFGGAVFLSAFTKLDSF